MCLSSYLLWTRNSKGDSFFAKESIITPHYMAPVSFSLIQNRNCLLLLQSESERKLHKVLENQSLTQFRSTKAIKHTKYKCFQNFVLLLFLFRLSTLGQTGLFIHCWSAKTYYSELEKTSLNQPPIQPILAEHRPLRWSAIGCIRRK